MKEYDYLVVGSGLFGMVFACLAKRDGKKCLIVEKRDHPGGNIYCENIEDINVHKYGAHIFHTSDHDVWRFVNQFVEFNRYTNSPVAKAPDGRLYNLPFNMNTFYSIWGLDTPEDVAKKLDEQRHEARVQLGLDNDTPPRNLEEQALVLIGRDIYHLLIKGYTEKQWGRKCTELPPDIIRRLPVRLVFDNNYFNDCHQGIPVGGYNRLIERLTDGVEVWLGCDYLGNRGELRQLADRVVYTGPIDAYFDYCYGRLDWRTVRFETESLPVANYQGNAVVNYTSADVPYTRVIEHKHFESFGQAVYDNPLTVISREYSVEWTPGMEPYYPINNPANTQIAEKYKALAAAESDVVFGGRLAHYQYYDMAPVIRLAMDTYQNMRQPGRATL